jgi:TPR repeat protein
VLVRNFDEIRRAADLGDAFAQAWMAWETVGEESFRWAKKSVAQGERDGFFWLGRCYRDGMGCEQDFERAKKNFLVASELGDIIAMVRVCDLFDKDNPERFVWLGRAAANKVFYSFLTEMVDQLDNFNHGIGHSKVVFAIGRALKGHINNENRTILNDYIRHLHRSCEPSSSLLRISTAIVSKSTQQLDNRWTEKRSCEGHSKDDREDDLGCERRSGIFGRETIRGVRAENRARVRR